jgi:glucosamine 6-phosphate synthetase-like amidotransferase/phosphosugar isomerase protein
MARWISQFRNDVYSQVEHLQGLRLPKSMNIRRGLFVGSGDSYTCALLMEYLSKHKILAYHPSDILRCPQMLSDHEIFFLSSSGRTRSNIEAAKIARKFDIKCTAVISRSKSALEEVCSETLNLDYMYSLQSSNTGILEFTATVIACMALIGIDINLNILGKIMSDAREQVNLYGVDLPTRFKSILFLGDGISYPLASYGALKMNELFGLRSFGYLLDDYYHSPIFSLKKPDCVFVLAHENVKNSISANFHNKLKKTHARSYYFHPQVSRSPFGRILFFIFVIQILGLTMAEKLEIDKPYYLSNKMILKLSSSLIY